MTPALPGLKPAARAFTLVELLVVIGIIALVLALVTPAFGPLPRPNELAEAVNSLNGVLTTAQTLAQSHGTYVAARIERAPRAGGPEHQQVRFVKLDGARSDARRTGEALFRYVPDSRIVPLPEGAWLAPAEPGVPFSEMFYLVFDQQGQNVRLNPPDGTIIYVDESNPGNPRLITAGQWSARGVYVYDREAFNERPLGQSVDDFFGEQGLPVYVSRFLGTTVEGRTQ